MGEDSSFIAVEWGSAALRATLVAPGGQIRDHLVLDEKLSDLSRADIVDRVAMIRNRWPAATQVWLAGMIGAAAGWQEVPHVRCPADATTIAAHARRVRIGANDCEIVPGLACTSVFGEPDVLRGEEMIALGWLSTTGAGRSGLLVCVPGMHGKWLMLDDGRIERFHTAMTVELVRLIATHSVVGQHIGTVARPGAAFDSAVDRGAKGGALARQVFGIRSAVLDRTLAIEDAGSTLWGLLIGSDAAEALAIYRATLPLESATVAGESLVAQLFTAAITRLGLPAEQADGHVLAIAGFAALRAASGEQRNAA